MPVILRAIALFACCGIINGAIALANTGTVLPLDQYQAGTEQTNSTIVPNGGFEVVAGGQPDGWTLQRTLGVSTPVGPNTGNNGAWSVQGRIADSGWYRRTIDVLPQTDYVLSAYMWAFASGGEDSEVSVWVHDQANNNGTYLGLVGGGRGAFVHRTFNSGPANELIINVGAFWMEAQLDNVALTPLSEFVPPVAIPEPIHLSLLTLTTSLARRPRRGPPAR